jgi:flavin-binding protein dodecin
MARATQTVRQIQAAWVQEQRVLVENDQITGR